MADGTAVDLRTGWEEETRARVARADPGDPQPPVEHRLVRGDAARAIARAAAGTKAELIVLGAHGRGGVSRLLMGSVAEGVMRQAPCPVPTVKQSFPATAGTGAGMLGDGRAG